MRVCDEAADLIQHATEVLQRAGDRLRGPGVEYCLEGGKEIVRRLSAADAAALEIHACLRQLEKRRSPVTKLRPPLDTQPLGPCTPSGRPQEADALAAAATAIQEVAPNAATGGQASL